MLPLLIRCVAENFTKAVKKYKVIHDLFYESREKLKLLKYFFSVLYGLIFGLALYKLVLCPLGIPIKWKLLVAAVSCLLNALLSSCFIQFRCISILILLEGLGKAGQHFLKALVLAFILLGPINNIVKNSKELSRVVECTTDLTYHLAKTKFDLAVKPFTNAFTHMEQNLSDVKDRFEEIHKVLKPILNEVELEDGLNKR